MISTQSAANTGFCSHVIAVSFGFEKPGRVAELPYDMWVCDRRIVRCQTKANNFSNYAFLIVKYNPLMPHEEKQDKAP